ncbi:ABC-type transport system permease protein (probable substrate spermidine/putrescine) [Natrialba magadii ATCC 43099]|uniref:ABC-type transport system permease protein (Probable substrate spermidine/putrescine) n=1 Tax=Natrialba magadii (strain ATCC 43099 / DSM 3394 / CCM 3739 / CIP 104546 / IAM 13178 / JCM 8861 / NBRC 102185 / NCIMB 2190 / MS3) TaxID=547559 RepID=D3SVW3_NATMM|nr:ABC transporter permease [Natrialba magadii]ADD03682.2 ABC-type transport system permease protein (probable substrate spermidine/putrescine) [Natrialba magadii ATCC 43099]ELY34447.1 binding-protein-dependent transport system inner membrane protein [Natrialba magadii ATCC 43099]
MSTPTPDSGSTAGGVRQRSRQYLRQILDAFRDRPRARLLVLVGIPAFVLLLFFILPLAYMVWLSFHDGMPPASLTLENYLNVVTTDLYLRVVWRTTVLTVQTTALVVILGYTLAYSMARFSKRTTLLLLLVILPFWTNYIVRMYALINIFSRDGLLDWMQIVTGLAQDPSGIMYTHTAVLLGLTYVWLPLATLPFYASLTNMDDNLIEAAKDLGAGPIETFFTVTLPMTKNGVIGGIILVAIPTFGAFVTPTLLGGTDQLMIGMVIENQFTEAFNWPFGSALSVIVSAFVVLMLLVAVKFGASDVVTRRSDTQ